MRGWLAKAASDLTAARRLIAAGASYDAACCYSSIADQLLGKAFVAVVVELHGRLLARPDGEHGPSAVLIDGVNPGACGFSAPNIRGASQALHGALTAILVDFAERADSFDAFKADVVRLF